MFRQPQLLTAGVGLPHILGQLDKLFNHLGHLNRPALVATESILQKFGECPAPDHVLTAAAGQFIPD